MIIMSTLQIVNIDLCHNRHHRHQRCVPVLLRGPSVPQPAAAVPAVDIASHAARGSIANHTAQTCSICSTISPEVRLRRLDFDMAPVAQKEHFMLQPTWLLTHSVPGWICLIG